MWTYCNNFPPSILKPTRSIPIPHTHSDYVWFMLNLKKSFTGNSLFKNSPQQRGIKYWNSLADDVKQCVSLQTFTKKLKFNLLNDIN